MQLSVLKIGTHVRRHIFSSDVQNFWILLFEITQCFFKRHIKKYSQKWKLFYDSLLVEISKNSCQVW